MSASLARQQSKGEYAADGVVHVVALVAAAVGVIILISMIAARGGLVELVAVSIYAAGLLAMLGFSTAYNLGRASRHSDLLRRFDRAAIFVMIAGTYTPFTVLGLDGVWQVSLISFVWAVALIGFALTLFYPRRLDGFSVAVYLVLGWAGIVAAGPFLDAFNSTILILLASGGVLYSVGTVFLAWRKLPYQNAIWHCFVVAAAAVHYGAVLDLTTTV